MSQHDKTSALVDGLLKFIAGGGLVTTALLAPNAVQIFDKPITKMLKQMDNRSRERELRRVAHYMKSRGLIAYSSNDYEHGIKLTSKGKARIKRLEFSNLSVPTPSRWDKKWRLVFFDLPVGKDKNRFVLIVKLRSLGFQPLQKSIWVHPYPCRQEIEVLSGTLGITKFVTYVEISEIDNEKSLTKRFHTLFNKKQK